ncbi:MAG TPA: fluoride efflux transporter CrcB [Chitinophagales bacterium]
MIKNAFLVFVGGGMGSVARYFITHFTNKNTSLKFPLATFLINVFGSLLIGVLLGYFKQKGIENSVWKFLLTIGFCGGFTTFSSFSAENIQLLQTGNTATAFAYIALSLVVGLGATWVGIAVMK